MNEIPISELQLSDELLKYLLADGSRPMSGNLNMDSHFINNVIDPTTNQQAATKKYVDDNGGGGTTDHAALSSNMDWLNTAHTGRNADAWVTSTAYTTGDYVENSGILYRCRINHTSGTFSTDFDAGNWEIIIEVASFNDLTGAAEYRTIKRAYRWIPTVTAFGSPLYSAYSKQEGWAVIDSEQTCMITILMQMSNANKTAATGNVFLPVPENAAATGAPYNGVYNGIGGGGAGDTVTFLAAPGSGFAIGAWHDSVGGGQTFITDANFIGSVVTMYMGSSFKLA